MGWKDFFRFTWKKFWITVFLIGGYFLSIFLTFGLIDVPFPPSFSFDPGFFLVWIIVIFRWALDPLSMVLGNIDISSYIPLPYHIARRIILITRIIIKLIYYYVLSCLINFILEKYCSIQSLFHNDKLN